MTLIRLDATALSHPPITFYLRVDWLNQTLLPDSRVVVELCDDSSIHPRVLGSFMNVVDAIYFARRWLDVRGFDYDCDVDFHRSKGNCHISMWAKTKKGKQDAQKHGINPLSVVD